MSTGSAIPPVPAAIPAAPALPADTGRPPDHWAKYRVASAATGVEADPWSKYRVNDPAGLAASPALGTLANAFEAAEGYGERGARPTRNNNPGDLKGWGDLPTDDGGYTKFPSYAAGRKALENQISGILAGKSPHYRSSMTIREVAGVWSPQGADQWAKNVASKLGVSEDTPFSRAFAHAADPSVPATPVTKGTDFVHRLAPGVSRGPNPNDVTLIGNDGRLYYAEKPEDVSRAVSSGDFRLENAPSMWSWGAQGLWGSAKGAYESAVGIGALVDVYGAKAAGYLYGAARNPQAAVQRVRQWKQVVSSTYAKLKSEPASELASKGGAVAETAAKGLYRIGVSLAGSVSGGQKERQVEETYGTAAGASYAAGALLGNVAALVVADRGPEVLRAAKTGTLGDVLTASKQTAEGASGEAAARVFDQDAEFAAEKEAKAVRGAVRKMDAEQAEGFIKEKLQAPRTGVVEAKLPLSETLSRAAEEKTGAAAAALRGSAAVTKFVERFFFDPSAKSRATRFILGARRFAGVQLAEIGANESAAHQIYDSIFSGDDELQSLQADRTAVRAAIKESSSSDARRLLGVQEGAATADLRAALLEKDHPEVANLRAELRNAYGAQKRLLDPEDEMYSPAAARQVYGSQVKPLEDQLQEIMDSTPNPRAKQLELADSRWRIARTQEDVLRAIENSAPGDVIRGDPPRAGSSLSKSLREIDQGNALRLSVGGPDGELAKTFGLRGGQELLVLGQRLDRAAATLSGGTMMYGRFLIPELLGAGAIGLLMPGKKRSVSSFASSYGVGLVIAMAIPPLLASFGGRELYSLMLDNIDSGEIDKAVSNAGGMGKLIQQSGEAAEEMGVPDAPVPTVAHEPPPTGKLGALAGEGGEVQRNEEGRPIAVKQPPVSVAPTAAEAAATVPVIPPPPSIVAPVAAFAAEQPAVLITEESSPIVRELRDKLKTESASHAFQVLSNPRMLARLSEEKFQRAWVQDMDKAFGNRQAWLGLSLSQAKDQLATQLNGHIALMPADEEPSDVIISRAVRDALQDYTPGDPKAQKEIEKFAAQLEKERSARRGAEAMEQFRPEKGVRAPKGGVPKSVGGILPASAIPPAPEEAQGAFGSEPTIPAPPAERAPVATTRPLPRELAGSKPRYGYQDKNFQLQFSSDTDKALYTVAQATKNKMHDAFMAWLRPQFPGLSDADIVALGRRVREAIKPLAKYAPEKREFLSIPRIMR